MAARKEEKQEKVYKVDKRSCLRRKKYLLKVKKKEKKMDKDNKVEKREAAEGEKATETK